MDSTQYEYLKLNKYLLFTIGIWPYQTTLQRSLVVIFFIPIIVAQVILQGGGMITAITANDIDSLLEGFAPFMISLMCLAKYINFFYNFKQMRRLLDIMREDWEIYKKLRNEYDLLCEQYAIGKKITISFVAFLFGLITPFAAMPLLLNAADALGLCNISDDRPLAFRVEHFVDVDKYYFPLLVHSYIGTLAYTTIVLAINSIIAVYVLHESGLCEVLRIERALYEAGKNILKNAIAIDLAVSSICRLLTFFYDKFKLENFVESDVMDVKLHANKRDDKWYENARDCVILHKHIIEFANILEDANTTSYLLQIGFNMICVSFTQFQAVINIQENAALAFRYISVTISLLCDLLFVSWPGQQLSDSTERIFEFTTNGKWYLSSINCRKLLMMMLSKSITPLKLTAYKFYTLNLESFSAVARTSFSYTMVLCSVQ